MNTPHFHQEIYSCFKARQPERRACGGFSLMEILVVVAVVAVLATVGVPALDRWLKSAKLTSAANTLLTSMHLARSEAIKRNARVVLCKSADGTACSSAGGWEQGWIVFHDANNNGTREADETIIQRVQPLSASVRLTGNTNVARYVSFLSTGATKLVSGAFQAGTLTICNQPSESEEGRQVVLNAVGRPRVQKIAAVACA